MIVWYITYVISQMNDDNKNGIQMDKKEALVGVTNTNGSVIFTECRKYLRSYTNLSMFL